MRVPGHPQFEVIQRGEILQIVDTESEMYANLPIRDIARARGFRSRLLVPLRSGSGTIGAISVTRVEPGAFAAHHVQLLQTFADQAVIAIQNARLFNETREALERQTATADILKVIASSPDNVQPVFAAIVTSAARVIGAFSAGVFRYVDGLVHLAAMTSVSPAGDDVARANFPRPIGDFHLRVAQTGEVVQVADTEDQPNARLKEIARARGYRSILYVPLNSSNSSVGAIAVTRKTAGSFAAHHIDLLQTFADQAVIAIDNVRLFNETKEALAHQTATSEVLQAIGSSMADTQPVFERILDSVERLFEVRQCSIILAREGMLHLVARRGIDIEDTDRLFPAPMAQTTGSEVIRTARQTYVPSAMSPLGSSLMRRVAELMGDYSVVMTPLVWEGQGIGIISAARAPNAVFSDKELALLRTFADQAVIAIENARLFNETQEALERQTATADILKVIASSPADVQPVFEAIAERSNRLVAGRSTAVYSMVDGIARLIAFTPTSPEADAAIRAFFPRPLAQMRWGEAIARGEVYEIDDVEGPSIPQDARDLARVRGYRSLLFVPLMHDQQLIGAISVTRAAAGKFAEHHVQLLKTFADQAVIAISNVKLFNEVQNRTRDLAESLEQQTATAEILSSISGSMDDTRPVFEAIVRSLLRLFGTRFAVVQTLNDGIIDMPAADGEAGFERLTQRYPRPLAADTVGGLAMLEKRTIQVQPVLGNPAAPEGTQGFARDFGLDSVLFTPMLSGDKVVGAIGVARREPKPFDDKQIALISSFANQAAIAIENTRLLRELRERTDDLGESLQQQTATADVLKVISRSAFDLNSVLDTLLSSAARLCGAGKGVIFQKDGDVYRLAASHGDFSEGFTEFAKANPIVVDRTTTTGRVVLAGTMVHIHDVLDDPAYTSGYKQFGEFRTVLGVPLLREGVPIGSFSLTRSVVQPFSERQIELVQTFADQAVIAIENARLLNELRMRTEELSRSLDDLRAAQDRLVQTEKLASLGQLTAGIAHEIKNPLNFVNNFSALSAELTDELDGLLKTAALTDKMRADVGELTGLMRSNLEKVVQHGKRADSIVKNMLLHSREGTGEQRSADVNALVEESLNLAYHGARAEKAGFNVTLQRDFDTGAGVAELFPQEITRALLNLIANGFYAATRRSGESGFEPTLRASTRNLGSRVEIRIRDNGTGIPPEVKEKMFNPFFTTKPAGEGTGLGLSMTHDIVVKQHGGKIDVATEPGEFTEFTIVLPRAGGPQNAG
jgi:GAF domain-containing protein